MHFTSALHQPGRIDISNYFDIHSPYIIVVHVIRKDKFLTLQMLQWVPSTAAEPHTKLQSRLQ